MSFECPRESGDPGLYANNLDSCSLLSQGQASQEHSPHPSVTLGWGEWLQKREMTVTMLA